ncbi:GTP cyclohydrolase I [Halococcus hamelinensis]|uniref:GTP cyclohydrolase I n=1 Tax=Halococcus hamelinensis TaxID=332168 RepID=UPI000AD6E169|nr:GTP cyclohydrolase I [Halococcus hamelinensis]
MQVDDDRPTGSTSGSAGSERAIDWAKAQEAARLFLEAIGEDPERSALVETWQRRLPATMESLSEGYRIEAKPAMRTFESEGEDWVVKTGIPVYSLCEHHLLPFYGTAHVAYRSNGSVVGLSKLIRYVQWKSRRLTIQERLTRELADGLTEEIDAGNVLVELRMTHLCESMRGVESETETTTRASSDSTAEDERQRFRDAIETHEDDDHP